MSLRNVELRDKSSREEKSSRFANKRKQKRAQRHRSDGFMVGKDMDSLDDDDDIKMDAVNFLSWLRNPNLQNLAKLRKCIRSNDVDWMTEFLHFDGLGLLFQCLKNLGSYKGHHLSDMVLRLECIMCIREVINSQSGVDCLLKIKERKDNIFGRRFASGIYNSFYRKYNIFIWGNLEFFTLVETSRIANCHCFLGVGVQSL